ncbi:Replication termination factor 2 [Microbotryomycetes sp. JL201]|nr:Replication termination factor 2 [Microbotryomycetes sp. JL201]
MGNDGGSIPKRDDLVRTKRARERYHDPKEHARLRWTQCALSKDMLREPVVASALGTLFNKEALIAYLLNPPTESDPGPFGNDGFMIAGHVKSLKDVTTLRLTPNPAATHADATAKVGDDATLEHAPFVCPISMREMNGSYRFLFRVPCGCVISEASLREMRKADSDGSADTRVCPVHGGQDDDKAGPEQWITINPIGAELEAMREHLLERQRLDKAAKKDRKKRKTDSVPAQADDDRASYQRQPPKKAKAGPTAQVAPSVKAAVPLLSASLAAKIAEQKKTQSPAIASLYAKKSGDDTHDADGRSTWMTRGAFTRYA